MDACAVNLRVIPGWRISPAVTELPSAVTLIHVASRASMSIVSACGLGAGKGWGSRGAGGGEVAGIGSGVGDVSGVAWGAGWTLAGLASAGDTVWAAFPASLLTM